MNKKGFTLIEIMIVVGIVALLAGLLVPGMLRARINANETSALATLRSFAMACENYAAAYAALYPSSIEDVTGGSVPYFSFDPTDGSRNGYTFTADFGNNAYTVTATPLPNAGNWHYQVSTGLSLKRSSSGGDWVFF